MLVSIAKTCRNQQQIAILCLLFIEVANVAPAAFTVLQIAHQMQRDISHLEQLKGEFSTLGLNQDFTGLNKDSSSLSMLIVT